MAKWPKTEITAGKYFLAETKSGRSQKAPRKTVKSTKLQDLEFRVYRLLESPQSPDLRQKSILIACSGGRDSVALVSCLMALTPRLKLKLGLCYVDHGPSADSNLLAYRKKAAKVVKALAQKGKLPLFIARSKTELKSEDSLRNFRMSALREIQEREGYSYLALGHHADDLFETRLIRLIRGTGGQGLEAMRVFRDSTLRPFLKENASVISLYAEKQGLKWCEDPSNLDSQYLRNWLRKTWLPQLEEKRPGSTRSFARSLETLLEERVASQEAQGDPSLLVMETMKGSDGSDLLVINRRRYMELRIPERQKALAAFLLRLQSREFTTQHIQEIRKRIETSRKEIRFRLLKFDWEINAELIRAFPSPS